MLCRYAESHYAEFHILFIVMLNVIMLSVVMLNVIMLSVVAPFFPVRRAFQSNKDGKEIVNYNLP